MNKIGIFELCEWETTTTTLVTGIVPLRSKSLFYFLIIQVLRVGECSRGVGVMGLVVYHFH